MSLNSIRCRALVRKKRIRNRAQSVLRSYARHSCTSHLKATRVHMRPRTGTSNITGNGVDAKAPPAGAAVSASNMSTLTSSSWSSVPLFGRNRRTSNRQAFATTTSCKCKAGKQTRFTSQSLKEHYQVTARRTTILAIHVTIQEYTRERKADLGVLASAFYSLILWSFLSPKVD